jgi:hypothetical protein
VRGHNLEHVHDRVGTVTEVHKLQDLSEERKIPNKKTPGQEGILDMHRDMESYTWERGQDGMHS